MVKDSRALVTLGSRERKSSAIVSGASAPRRDSSSEDDEPPPGRRTTQLPRSCRSAIDPAVAGTPRHSLGWPRGKDSTWATRMPMTMKSWFMIPRARLAPLGARSARTRGTVVVATPQPRPITTLAKSVR